jgi:hypothetical protein
LGCAAGENQASADQTKEWEDCFVTFHVLNSFANSKIKGTAHSGIAP